MGKIVEVRHATVGGLLEEDVVNAQGMVLLKKGTVFEEKHSKILKRWGIKKIAIMEPQEAQENASNTEEQIAQKTELIKKELDLMFQNLTGNQYMMELKEMVQNYRIEKLQKSGDT